eukprot:superscaffoldBa00002844_g15447
MFTGATCEIQIDECQSQPCLNGGSCHDYAGGFNCTCLPGFQGHQCKINIDECQEQPCQNGALCIDGVNEYSCDCSHTAFTGRHCETPQPPCHSEPCFNNAICKDDQGNYSCECWPGSLCQEVINQCDPSPCHNGGMCESHVGGYTCHCLKESGDGIVYGGINCDVRLVGCDGHECQNQGSCSPFLLDGTHGYTCSCSPGYTGNLCKTPTTFSFERSGYLLLQNPLVDAEVSCNITLSFKTVLPRAMLFQRKGRGLLLSLELEEGQLRLTLRKEAPTGAEPESPTQVLELPHNVTDGEWHSVEAVLGHWVLSLKLLDDAESCESQSCHKVAPVQSILTGLVSPPQNTFIGGVLKDSNGPGEDSPLPAFIGCMQDVFVDWQLIVPQEWLSDSAVNVSPGCSHRDRCLDVPCQNRGQCVNLWQSYQCRCPRPYEGQDCEEGYSNATFLNDSTVLSYRGNGNIFRNLTNLSLNLRTRRRNAAILHAEKDSAFVTLSIQDGFLFMELQSTPRGEGEETEEEQTVSTVSLSSRSSVSDGEWHSVHLFMAAPWAPTSRWTLVLDEEIDEASTSRHQGGNLDFLKQGVDIFLGGLAPDAGWSLTGCLSTVEVGSIALPYFSSSDVNLPRLQEEQFIQTSWHPPLLGCSGAPVCQPNPCQNGGECRDLFNSYNCSCAEGWAGRRCNFFTDTCASNPCVHGNCSVNGLTYECTCEFGYAGADCEEEVDMCENHLCAHGGTCLHGPDRYACLCPENYTGPLCKRPKLPVSVCGDDTRNYTCFNGGNCTDRELSCDCPPGFIGHRCEQEVDECKSNPCLNGGYCRNLINKFICVCDMSFAGDMCQTDVSDIYFYVAVLLWQNLFQLLSYLILRLDDEPEMERAPYSSRVAAVLAPCLVGLAIVVMLALALAVAKLRERRQTEGGFGSRQLEAPGGRYPPAELGNASISTLAARVERLLTSEGLTSDLLLSISLVSIALLLVLILTSVGLVVALNRRATHGTYSPSRQEKEGSRVEMWSITQPPPMERLI